MRWPAPQPLVEATDSNTGFLHHIGNADAFEAEFTRPPGCDSHNPNVRLRLISLRVAHLPSPSLPLTRTDLELSPSTKCQSNMNEAQDKVPMFFFHMNYATSVYVHI
jgi:hypothetical protein